MKHLDLFSGIGGFALAARWVGWETIGFCEIDPYCQRVLRKHWPGVPIYEDVRELDDRTVGHVDIITGGYPCQPFSVAGKRRGETDDRHLWSEAYRLVREIEPTWVVFENVAGHITMGLDEVLADLERLSYTWEAFVIPACAVDAQHRRDRIWIVGNTDDKGQPDRPINDETSGVPKAVADTKHIKRQNAVQDGCDISLGGETETEDRIQGSGKIAGCGSILADSDSQGLQERPINSGMAGAKNGRSERQASAIHGGWAAEPAVGRVVDGLPGRVDRIRSLGNAIVPQVAEMIFRAIQDTDQTGESQ